MSDDIEYTDQPEGRYRDPPTTSWYKWQALAAIRLITPIGDCDPALMSILGGWIDPGRGELTPSEPDEDIHVDPIEAFRRAWASCPPHLRPRLLGETYAHRLDAAGILSVTGTLNREAITELLTSEHLVVREFGLAAIARREDGTTLLAPTQRKAAIRSRRGRCGDS